MAITQKLGTSALAKAIYERLGADDLTSSLTFYSRGAVPSGASHPYHEIGQFSGRRDDEFSSRDTTAETTTFVIDCWYDETSGVGEKAVRDVMDDITQAVTNTDLSVTGYQTPFKVWLDFSDVLYDTSEPIEPIWHGVLRFRVWMAPN